jgi:hypothetical protein
MMKPSLRSVSLYPIVYDTMMTLPKGSIDCDVTYDPQQLLGSRNNLLHDFRDALKQQQSEERPNHYTELTK